MVYTASVKKNISQYNNWMKSTQRLAYLFKHSCGYLSWSWHEMDIELQLINNLQNFYWCIINADYI